MSRRAGISQRATGMGNNLGGGQFSRRKGKIAYKLKKAQNGEPHLRLPKSAHSDGRAAQARNAQPEVNQACPPLFAGRTAPQGRAPRPRCKAMAW